MRIGILALLFLFGWLNCCAATRYVSIGGSDTNAGTLTAPFRTIQKGASAATPGDTVLIGSGSYDEYVTTSRGGTNEATRIAIKADGNCILRGFSIQHPYVTVDGFNLTRHSDPNRYKGYVEVTAAGDFFQILNNTFRDALFVIPTNVVFSSTGTIFTPSGGFLAAGFKPGLTITIIQCSKTNLANSDRVFTIQSVTDDTITVLPSATPVNEGPTVACIDAAPVYGVVVNMGASFGVVRGNTFRNLGYDCGFFSGDHNLFENNVFEQVNGWNVMRYSGSYNIYRKNWIRSSPARVYVISPDVFEDWSSNPVHHMLFENNFVQGFDGALGIHHVGQIVDHSDLTFVGNVFMDAGRFVVKMQNCLFVNNTFVNASAVPSQLVSADPHPITFQNGGATYSAENSVIKNNIFVGCGYQAKDPNLHGWYEFLGGVTNYTIRSNFVAGVAPWFDAKAGFAESTDLNGGDPGFVNIVDPLGPDELPFTDDDGLRLRSDSKLKQKGDGGEDLGAYAIRAFPKLTILNKTNEILEISWPFAATDFNLQSTMDLSNDWRTPTGSSVITNGLRIYRTTPASSELFFRLVK